MRLWESLKSRIINLRKKRTSEGEDEDFDPPTVTLTDRQDYSENSGPDDTAVTIPLSFLYALTKRWAWQAVAFRCETHPQEVMLKERDSNGDTILHWACFGSPPLDVIEAILRTCPELATLRNHKGYLPLHTACCYRASSLVIRILVQVYPESAGMTIESNTEQGGSTPLHLLCDYGCQAASLRAILETDAGAASTQKHDWIYNRTALQILNERKNLNEFHSHLVELRRLKKRNPDALCLAEDGQRVDRSMETALLLERISSMGFWEKVQILALAEFTQRPVTTVEPTFTTVIHALIGLRFCPPAILDFASFIIPQELMRPDEQGDLALHFAARHSNDDVICDVLRAQTKAACVPDASGLLPLQIYLERDRKRIWNHVVHQLIVAFPLVIEHMDIDRRLYPLIWSRLGGMSPIIRSSNIDALFLSIQGNPSCFG